jgi:glycosyltransferase involved in cell wall biosynthesis
MNESPDILVIIPAFNEEHAIGGVIRELREIQPEVEVLVVDDGSTDRTLDVVRNSGCKAVSLAFNLGIGGAVQTGFKYAVQYGYPYAVQVDGDGQHIASEIHVLMRAIMSGEADVVIGSRFIEHKGYTTSFIRRLGVTVFVAVNSLVLRKRITDNTSGFRAYNRRAITFLAENYPQDYPEPESVIMLGMNGFRIQEVGVIMRERAAGQSSISAVRSVYYMIKVLLAIFVDIFKERVRR